MLGQVAVDANEIAAMPVLLEMLGLKARVVTADGMHTQRQTARTVCDKGGDYVLDLEKNQGSLHEDITLYPDDPEICGNLPSFQSVDSDHGRIETRCATVFTDIGWPSDRHD